MQNTVACAYSTGSFATSSKEGKRITANSRGGNLCLIALDAVVAARFAYLGLVPFTHDWIRYDFFLEILVLA